VHFNESLTGLTTEPVIRALGAHAEEIRLRELENGLKRLKGLTEEQRSVIESLTKSVVSKILADPITFLRKGNDDEVASAVSRLFDLPDMESETRSIIGLETIEKDDDR